MGNKLKWTIIDANYHTNIDKIGTNRLKNMLYNILNYYMHTVKVLSFSLKM